MLADAVVFLGRKKKKSNCAARAPVETSKSWSTDGKNCWLGWLGWVGWLVDRFDVWLVDDALWGLRGVEALGGGRTSLLLVRVGRVSVAIDTSWICELGTYTLSGDL